MRWGFVHDWIIHQGGAERLFFRLIQQTLQHENQSNHTKHMPYAIFTLISQYDSITVEDVTIPIYCATPQWLRKLCTYYQQHKPHYWREKIWAKLRDYRNLILLYPFFMRRLSHHVHRYHPDQVRISSANISKNISTPKKTKKWLYLHSPMMYIQKAFHTSRKNLPLPAQYLLRIRTPFLRRWDTHTRQYNQVRVNSQHTQKQAYEQYQIRAEIAYPYIDYQSASPLTITSIQKEKYFLYVGRLVKNLRHVDSMIQLANRNKIPLIIVGDGPDARSLRSMSNNTIEFVGYVYDRKKLRHLFNKAQGYINLAYESAGMGTIEALLAGLPVFGYQAGGTAELIHSKNGITTTSLQSPHIDKYRQRFAHAIQKNKYNPDDIKNDIQERLHRYNRNKTLYPHQAR